MVSDVLPISAEIRAENTLRDMVQVPTMKIPEDTFARSTVAERLDRSIFCDGSSGQRLVFRSAEAAPIVYRASFCLVDSVFDNKCSIDNRGPGQDGFKAGC